MNSSALLIADDVSLQFAGSTIIPFRAVNIELKKEILTVRLHNDTAYVSVYLKFFNPGEKKKLIVGFVTPPYYTFEGLNDKYLKPEISNFNVYVNSKSVVYKINVLGKSNFTYIKKMKEKFSAEDYTYYFNAEFSTGENIIEHSYDFKCSAANNEDNSIAFPYLLTTGKMWGNKEIEDFTLNIYPEEYNYFNIQRSFEKADTSFNWQLQGNGRVVNSDNGLDVFIQNGYLQFHKIHFKPDYDLQISTLEYVQHHGIDKSLDDDMNAPNVFSLDTLKLNHIPKLSIFRNAFYAKAGYLFKDETLLNYFSKYIWYSPDSTKTADDIYRSFSPNEKKQIKEIIDNEEIIRKNKGKL